MAMLRGDSSPDARRTAAVCAAARPLRPDTGEGLDWLVERAGRSQIVMIGDASHGTADFARIRQVITRRLIEEHGFTAVAAEADWPDAARIDDYVRGRSSRALPVDGTFGRFPRWMWRNTDFRDFTEWLRGHNSRRDPAHMCAFHGLDLYSMHSSIHEVLRFLDARDPALGHLARERYACILPFAEEPQDYASAVLARLFRDCEGEVAAMLADLLRRQIDASQKERRDFFDTQQNARIIRNAERYYRALFRSNVESWNVRSRHMFETLIEIMQVNGEDSRIIIWGHNSHIGDAIATQMGSAGQVNLGQLVQEHYVNRAFGIGQGTHTGTVTAARDWGEPPHTMTVRPSLDASLERILHDTGLPAFTLGFDSPPDSLRQAISGRRIQRAIGVVYKPDTERMSHYFLADVMRQFDAYIWMDTTTALRPLDDEPAPNPTHAFAGHPFTREEH